MSSHREARARAWKIAAAVVVVLLFLGWAFLRPQDDGSEVGEARPVPSRPAVPSQTPSPSASSSPSGTAIPTPPTNGMGSTGTGLQGDSINLSIEKHQVRLRAWSSRPMAFAAWFVPTRQAGKRGATRLPGKTWSMTTTVYGKPDYAQVFLQTTKDGTPVHCQITVDGKVTARETTEGPFGTILCQG